jgi:hypothetical protein
MTSWRGITKWRSQREYAGFARNVAARRCMPTQTATPPKSSVRTVATRAPLAGVTNDRHKSDIWQTTHHATVPEIYIR